MRRPRHLEPEEVERIVEEALGELPPFFRDRLENVAVIVEDEPTDHDLDELDLDDNSELLGIFRGVALTERSFSMLPQLPNQIAIFRGPIVRTCRTHDQAVEQVRDTVMHELGHYFGLSDAEMAEHGL